jgi:hypothetical protein
MTSVGGNTKLHHSGHTTLVTVTRKTEQVQELAAMTVGAAIGVHTSQQGVQTPGMSNRPAMPQPQHAMHQGIH